MRQRDTSIDIAKGVAIVAIVVGHVLRGLRSAGMVDNDETWFVTADRALYMVHLAVFAAAAGLMVRGSLERRGARVYVRERCGDFLWVYLVWSVLQGLLQYVLSSVVNTSRSLASVFTLWIPTNQMWFIPWIALVTVLVSVAQPWRSGRRATLTLAGAAVVSVLSWGAFGPFIFMQGLGLSIFFFAGATLTHAGYARIRQALDGTGTVLVAAVSAAVYTLLIVLGTAAAPTTTRYERTALTIGQGVVCACAGVLAVMALSVLLARTRAASRVLVYLGKRSMPIFLAHTMALSATRIVLTRLGVDDVVLHAVVGSLVGVLGAVVVWRATVTRAAWLWRAPALLTGR